MTINTSKSLCFAWTGELDLLKCLVKDNLKLFGRNLVVIKRCLLWMIRLQYGMAKEQGYSVNRWRKNA